MRKYLVMAVIILLYTASILALAQKKADLETAASENVRQFLESLVKDDPSSVLQHVQAEYRSDENHDANIKTLTALKAELARLGKPDFASDIIFSAKSAALPKQTNDTETDSEVAAKSATLPRQKNQVARIVLKQDKYSNAAVYYKIGLVSEDSGFYIDRLRVQIKTTSNTELDYKLTMVCSEAKNITANCEKRV